MSHERPLIRVWFTRNTRNAQMKRLRTGEGDENRKAMGFTRKQRCMNRSGADIATVTLRQQEVAKKLTTTPREAEVLE
ncbi:hypothetical protein PCANC_03696 [Puccinia coronata f. sp. avenae]|uniref:Uncharacterized protein n=1 Tax=Puccinia coronata f. sp. avenae TaxID=200324 RepID=A0A2N5VXS1_9BASI|nr:hypothetical protein PCASD_03750 [Puccinia coronata f. sp. avenae]PLW54780.1 hypothetical protein PCANC_03696 [Puccinia coronata f. sp. avenae]